MSAVERQWDSSNFVSYHPHAEINGKALERLEYLWEMSYYVPVLQNLKMIPANLLTNCS